MRVAHFKDSKRAQNEIRTRDLILTKDVLYQLSYLGKMGGVGFEPTYT